MSQPDTSLRARKRRAVQDDLTLAAIDLFITNGYDETTVEKIAASVGMSERTFFRYFATKDDVLEQLSAYWRDLAARTFAERPADESDWVSIRRCFDDFVESTRRDDFALPLLRLIYATPQLYGRHMHNVRRWRQMFEGVLRTRHPQAPDLAIRVKAASAMACMECAREAWVATDGERPIADLIDAAMSEVWPLV